MSGVMAEIKSGFYKVKTIRLILFIIFFAAFQNPSLPTQMDKLKVSLPKFSIRGSLELNEPLASLNISKLFGAGGHRDDHHDEEEEDDDVFY